MYIYLPLLNVYTSISWVKKLDDPARKELEFFKETKFGRLYGKISELHSLIFELSGK